jgi:hypothetical protein
MLTSRTIGLLIALLGGSFGMLLGRPAAVDGVMAEIDANASRCAREDVEAEIAAAEKAAHEARVKACKKLRHERPEATIDKVQAKLRELRERLGHRVQH